MRKCIECLYLYGPQKLLAIMTYSPVIPILQMGTLRLI